MTAYFFGLWLACALIFHLSWAVTKKKSNVTAVDAIWASSIPAICLIHALLSDADLPRRILVGLCISFWGARLSLHLWNDRVRSGQEDGRYAKFRRQWGGNADRNFWFLFQAQALLVFALSSFIWPSLINSTKFGAWYDYLGLSLWAVAITGQALADRQLKDFKAKKTGKTLQAGLWRYSRHPNYFFEWVHWFAYVFWAWGSDWELLALGGPILMLWFLIKVTGIPAAEEQSLRSRGDEYREYQRRTSAFIPWFPKKGSAK